MKLVPDADLVEGAVDLLETGEDLGMHGRGPDAQLHAVGVGPSRETSVRRISASMCCIIHLPRWPGEAAVRPRGELGGPGRNPREKRGTGEARRPTIGA